MKFTSVMLVDDDEINNFIITRMFKKMDLSDNVIIKTNGSKALKYINELVESGKEIPSLLLVDMHMPDMTGVELLLELKKLPVEFSEMTIIPISNGVHPSDQIKLQEIGLKGYIVKPISFEKIQTFLESVKPD
jgi:CheY-like chemotaxis protein